MKNPWRESAAQRKTYITLDQNKRVTDFSLSPSKSKDKPLSPNFKKKST